MHGTELGQKEWKPHEVLSRVQHHKLTLGEPVASDNYAAHKHPKVKAWLARRPRHHPHYTPT